ncbi:MAG: epoxide hydrolase, partial [Hymenobacter sp.]
MEAFKINVPQPALDDLQNRLAHTRWPDEVEEADWGYGTNREYLRQLADYWQHGYDWRAQEAELNQFPHFKAEVGGLNIHYIKVEGKGPSPLP